MHAKALDLDLVASLRSTSVVVVENKRPEFHSGPRFSVDKIWVMWSPELLKHPDNKALQ